MEAKEVLLSALDVRWTRYRTELKNCRAEFSEKAVHDLRVESRRLLAVFELLRAVLSFDQIQKARRELKDQLDELDELRDVQVLLADVSEYIGEIPELKPVRKRLREKEKKLLKDARKLISKEEKGDLSKRIKKIRERVEDLTDLLARTKLFDALDEAYARVLNRYADVDTQNADSIHRLRIAFKKFRYMVEITHSLIENFPPENLERMHTYQTLMGEVQDMEMALQQISDLQEEISEAKFTAARQGYENRLKLALSNYLKQHSDVLTFWRPAPNQSFPWEQ